VRSRRKGSVEDSGRPVLIGYWKSDHEPNWPDPRDFVDASWSAYERREVAEYLSNGTVVVKYRGLSPCRFCGQDNGHREFTDGTYQWPEGLAHYLWVHEVRLPVVVVAHIKSRLVGFEGDGLDREWWRTAHIDLGSATSTPPYTALARRVSEYPPTVKSSARVRLESAVSDWFSQRQSDAVIYAKADGLRSALEEATRLGEVTDMDASLYRGILKSAPPSGRPRFEEAQRQRSGRGQRRWDGQNDLICAPDHCHNCRRCARIRR
jgi:hypothetical protein